MSFYGKKKHFSINCIILNSEHDINLPIGYSLWSKIIVWPSCPPYCWSLVLERSADLKTHREKWMVEYNFGVVVTLL